MMSLADKFKIGDKTLERLVLKIGIHYGPVIAGVIGYHKP
jgi:class 3 adenylate cyclase